MKKKKLFWIALPIATICLLVFLFNYINYLSYSDRVNVVLLEEYLSSTMNKIEKKLDDKSNYFPYFKEENIFVSIRSDVFNYTLTSNGSIIARNKNMLIIFFPVKQEKEYIWKCSGYPKKYMPSKCR